jgi:PAS domain S-box-containing protein
MPDNRKPVLSGFAVMLQIAIDTGAAVVYSFIRTTRNSIRRRRVHMDVTGRQSFDSGIMEAIFDSIADGIFTVDEKYIITSFNHGAEEITGVPADKALGRHCFEVLRADICKSECALKKAIAEGQSFIKYPIAIANARGESLSLSITASPLRDKEGSVIGGIETFRNLALIEELHRKVQGVASFQDIVARSKRMKEIISVLPRIAESESTVLIEGESGTGKDLIAKAIHNLSSRRKGPLVIVNCGAIPDTLLESELFGYSAGAFTDAKKDKPGRFAQADEGTIFLDEIGDVSPALQVRLLRVLQEKSFEPLGSTKTVTSNVRVIAATNKNLSEEVKAERFRQDLYYRINVIKMILPPLRERMDDILLISDRFIDRMNFITKKNIQGLSPRTIEAFMNHDWPGNIRELENVIEHAFVLCENGLILCHHLPESWTCRDDSFEMSLVGKTLKEIETKAIYDALSRNNWNRSAAARELNIDKSTIWRKIKKLGLVVPSPTNE